MSDRTPAETLRKAAGLMRKKAREATPGPWVIRERHGRDDSGEGWSDARVVSDRGDVAVTYLSDVTESDYENAEWIVSIHPAVGLALADWLDTFEGRMEEQEFMSADWNAALTIARVFLGEVSDA